MAIPASAAAHVSELTAFLRQGSPITATGLGSGALSSPCPVRSGIAARQSFDKIAASLEEFKTGMLE